MLKDCVDKRNMVPPLTSHCRLDQWNRGHLLSLYSDLHLSPVSPQREGIVHVVGETMMSWFLSCEWAMTLQERHHIAIDIPYFSSWGMWKASIHLTPLSASGLKYDKLCAYFCLPEISTFWIDIHQLFFWVTWNERDRQANLICVVVWASEFGIGFINQDILFGRPEVINSNLDQGRD